MEKVFGKEAGEGRSGPGPHRRICHFSALLRNILEESILSKDIKEVKQGYRSNKASEDQMYWTHVGLPKCDTMFNYEICL